MKNALVVGINNYLFSPLKNCLNDAEDIHLTLDSPEYGFNVKVLLDKDATRRNILKNTIIAFALNNMV